MLFGQMPATMEHCIKLNYVRAELYVWHRVVLIVKRMRRDVEL